MNDLSNKRGWRWMIFIAPVDLLSGGDHGFIDDVTWLSFYGDAGVVPGNSARPRIASSGADITDFCKLLVFFTPFIIRCVHCVKFPFQMRYCITNNPLRI